MADNRCPPHLFVLGEVRCPWCGETYGAAITLSLKELARHYADAPEDSFEEKSTRELLVAKSFEEGPAL